MKWVVLSGVWLRDYWLRRYKFVHVNRKRGLNIHDNRMSVVTFVFTFAFTFMFAFTFTFVFTELTLMWDEAITDAHGFLISMSKISFVFGCAPQIEKWCDFIFRKIVLWCSVHVVRVLSTSCLRMRVLNWRVPWWSSLLWCSIRHVLPIFSLHLFTHKIHPWY